MTYFVSYVEQNQYILKLILFMLANNYFESRNM